MNTYKMNTIFRWWFAANLAVSGLAWAVLAIIHPIDVRPFWLLRRAIAVVLGTGILSAAYFLAIRFQSRDKAICQVQPTTEFNNRFLVRVADGFLVFSIASFFFNLCLVVFRGYDLSPTFDFIHLIPTLLANGVWEALIHRSGGSLVIFFSSVVVFDGVIGGLVGIIFSPLRFIPKTRIGVLVLHFLLFCAFEFVLAKWFLFRC